MSRNSKSRVEPGIHLFSGPMGSGKSKRLIQIQKLLKRNDIEPFCISFAGDTRADELTKERLRSPDEIFITTRDQTIEPILALRVSVFTQELFDRIAFEKDSNGKTRYGAVLIDEFQFIADAAKYVSMFPRYNISVYISCLNGTYDQVQWPEVTKIHPFSASVVVLKGTCEKCKNPNSTVHSIRTGDSKVLIDLSVSYMSVCPPCFWDK